MRYFIDTEFDGYQGPLISMALVREDGRSLYFVVAGAEDAATDTWVIDNVLPILRDCPEPPMIVQPYMVPHAIDAFLDGDQSVLITADWPADLKYFADAIEMEGGKMIDLPGLRMEVVRVDAYPTTLPGAVQHNAWWDAAALRERIEADEEADLRAGFAP